MMPAVYEVLDTLCQGLQGLMGGIFSTKPAVQMSRARSRESQRMILDHYRGKPTALDKSASSAVNLIIFLLEQLSLPQPLKKTILLVVVVC